MRNNYNFFLTRFLPRKGKVVKMKELIFKVEGMMCGGCENRVKNALETIDGVESVLASHEEGTVKVTLNKEIDENVIKEKIEDIGYEVK